MRCTRPEDFRPKDVGSPEEIGQIKITEVRFGFPGKIRGLFESADRAPASVGVPASGFAHGLKLAGDRDGVGIAAARGTLHVILRAGDDIAVAAGIRIAPNNRRAPARHAQEHRSVPDRLGDGRYHPGLNRVSVRSIHRAPPRLRLPRERPPLPWNRRRPSGRERRDRRNSSCRSRRKRAPPQQPTVCSFCSCSSGAFRRKDSAFDRTGADNSGGTAAWGHQRTQTQAAGSKSSARNPPVGAVSSVRRPP